MAKQQPMKHCRLCKFATRSIAKMGAHYRAKHPRAMAKRKKKDAKKKGKR